MLHFEHMLPSRRYFFPEIFLFIVFTTLLFSWLHRHATFLDPDAFYHAKMAMLLRDHGALFTFPWLPATTLAHAFVDQQLLYHTFLIPFVTFLPPLWGMHVASVVLSVFAMTSFYLLVRLFAPRLALLATLSLLSSSAFLTRLLLGKAQPLALVLLFLFFFAALRRKPWLLFCTSFLFVWMHGSWPMLALVALLLFIFGERRLALFAMGGLALGFSPYFFLPGALMHFMNQTVRMALLGESAALAGVEWHVPLGSDILAWASVQILLLIATFIVLPRALQHKTLSSRTLLFFVSALVFIFLTLSARRHIEFAVPLVTLAFVSAIADCGLLSWHALRMTLQRACRFFPQRVLSPLFILLGFIFFTGSIMYTDERFAGGHAFSAYHGAANVLKSVVPEDALIVLSDWSIFPQFFFATNHRYLMGLDPRFLLIADAARYTAWQRLLTDTIIVPSALLRDVLGASVLVVRSEDRNLLERARRDTVLTEIFSDTEATIFIL